MPYTGEHTLLPREEGWPIHANPSPFTAFSLLSLKKRKIISQNILTVEPTQLPMPVFGNHLSVIIKKNQWGNPIFLCFSPISFP